MRHTRAAGPDLSTRVRTGKVAVLGHSSKEAAARAFKLGWRYVRAAPVSSARRSTWSMSPQSGRHLAGRSCPPWSSRGPTWQTRSVSIADEMWDAQYERLCAEVARTPAPRTTWAARESVARDLARELASRRADHDTEALAAQHDIALGLAAAARLAIDYERETN